LRAELLGEHHLLQKNNSTHGMVKSQFVLVKLREDSADVEMSISLDLGLLESGLNGESTLQEVKSSSHLSNSAVVTSHIVISHGLA
jgi:hypothetical protein